MAITLPAAGPWKCHDLSASVSHLPRSSACLSINVLICARYLAQDRHIAGSHYSLVNIIKMAMVCADTVPEISLVSLKPQSLTVPNKRREEH